MDAVKVNLNVITENAFQLPSNAMGKMTAAMKVMNQIVKTWKEVVNIN